MEGRHVYLVFENWPHDSNLIISPPTTNRDKALAAGAKAAEAHKFEQQPEETLRYRAGDTNEIVAMWENDRRSGSITVEKWPLED